MPKKAHVKKATFRKFCREQVKKGLINQPDGTWLGGAGPHNKNDKNMARDMIAGYHFNR